MFHESSVIIGVPICEAKAYILPDFLRNQMDIRVKYANSRTVFAVLDDKEERDFAEKSELKQYGDIIYYKTIKPENHQAWLYNIVSAREAIRNYTLRSGADYLLVCDVDITFDPNIISILVDHIGGFDAVFSAYAVRQTGSWGFGSSPVMFRRELLMKFHYRCKMWGANRFLAEDEQLEYDLFKLRAKVNRGGFVTNTHYSDDNTGHTIKCPFKIPLFRQITNSLPFRFAIIGIGQIVHYDVALALHKIMAHKKNWYVCNDKQ